MALSELTAVVPPPAEPGGTGVDWDAVERGIGLRLPGDYKDFVARYGPGGFGDFLHPYQPDADDEELDLVDRQRADLDALREIQEEFPEDVPYRLAGPAELVSVALTDNGDIVYWHVTDPEDPDSWTITVNESRGPEWFRYDGPFTSFLADALSRRVEVTVFPEDFPDPGEAPSFIPYDD